MNPDAASLDHLHDIVVPPSVPWWPPAPGWMWLGGFFAALLLVLAVRLFVRRQAGRYRREALKELRRHARALERREERTEALAAIAGLLKRAALTAFPREEVASLTGPDWMAFLDRTGRAVSFARDGGERLERAAYDPSGAAEVDVDDARRLEGMARQWLISHRAGAGEGRC